MGSSSIAAVVVTFNRKLLLKECLDALLKQTHPIDRIYLIDNASTDGTLDFLEGLGYLTHPLIEYIRLPSNTGGAGGFYEGLKHAHQASYDWIWVMDDDAEPMPNALEILLNSKSPEELKIFSGLCGIKIGLDGSPQYVHRGRFSSSIGAVPLTMQEAQSEQAISYASFVGLLINTKAIDLIGYPLPEFFIWFDDIEYCQRMQTFGPIFYNPASVILHKDNVPSQNGGQSQRVKYRKTGFSNQWKALCGFRNYIYVMRIHGGQTKWWCFNFLLKTIFKVVFFEEGGLYLVNYYIDYWMQGVGFRPFKTIGPSEWSGLNQLIVKK